MKGSAYAIPGESNREFLWLLHKEKKGEEIMKNHPCKMKKLIYPEKTPDELQKSKQQLDYVSAGVCKYLGFTRDQMRSGCRRVEYVRCRNIICFLLRKNTNFSLNKIADIINKNHASVHHGLRAISDEMSVNKDIEYLVYQIEKTL